MSHRSLRLAFLLAASACARSEDVPDEALEAAEAESSVLPAAVEPAEPAVVQQVPAAWQTAARGEGTTLRLVTASDEVLMTLACANVPREFVATVPSFARNPNDSRFSLSMQSAPLILVADVATTADGQGVVARAPVPDNLAAQMGSAREITAMYGAAKLGPYAAPSVEMARDLLKACGIAAENLPPLQKAADAG